MAAAVGPSHASATENASQVTTDQPPKSYREAVGGSKVAVAATTIETDAVKSEERKDKSDESEIIKTKEVKPKEPVVVKVKMPAAVKDKNGGQEKTEKDSNQDKELKDKGTVKKFDPKTYVEAPPPKTNPWKKSLSLDTPPPTPNQVPPSPSSAPGLPTSIGNTNRPN